MPTALKVQSFSSQDILRDPVLEKELQAFCLTYARGPNKINFYVENFERVSSSLFYLIHKTDRFDEKTGRIFVLRSNSEIVGISGISQFPLHPLIAHAGVRSLLHPNYVQRFTITSHLLPEQLNFAFEKGYKEFVITFDETNKGLSRMVQRMTEGKLVLFGQKGHDFLKDVIILPYSVKIHGVPQSVVIKKMDPSFTFNYPPFSQS